MARVDAMLGLLLEARGSDLHLEAGQPPIARRDGELEPLGRDRLGAEELKDLIFEILSDEGQSQLAEDLDLDLGYAYDDRARFRVHVFHDLGGIAATFRAVPGRVPTLDELGCPELLRRLCDRRAGLVLVAGHAGSGKSSTLAAMIDQINRTRACRIVTIEAPVEHVHRPLRAEISHREVGPDATTYAAALRSAARDDADVLLVGELATAEVIELALDAAGAGALVLASVRAGGAVSALERLLHAFPADAQPRARGLLAETLAAVVAQQLLRAADGKGRVAAREILLGSSALASMIREGKLAPAQSLMQAGQAVGMQTMDMAIERLWQDRLVTGEEALDRVTDKDALQRAVGRRTGPVMG
jgi:twitching motility protein PilT